VRRNPCSLPPFTMNQDVHDLPQLLKNKLDGPVRYACSYWAGHLRLSPTSGDYVRKVIGSATGMLNNAPPWIEVMSLENRLEEVIRSMYSLLAWLDEVSSSLLPPCSSITPQTKGEPCGQTRGWEGRRHSVRPCDGLPPVVNTLLPSNPTMCPTNIPHRLASLTNLVTAARILPSERCGKPAIPRSCLLRSP
jgi:hypothetical protein